MEYNTNRTGIKEDSPRWGEARLRGSVRRRQPPRVGLQHPEAALAAVERGDLMVDNKLDLLSASAGKSGAGTSQQPPERRVARHDMIGKRLVEHPLLLERPPRNAAAAPVELLHRRFRPPEAGERRRHFPPAAAAPAAPLAQARTGKAAAAPSTARRVQLCSLEAMTKVSRFARGGRQLAVCLP